MYVQNIKLTQVTLVHFFWPLLSLEACLEPGDTDRSISSSNDISR